jgi:hypothetical protein
MKKYILLAIILLFPLVAVCNIFSDIHVTGWVPPESRYHEGFEYKHYSHKQYSNIFEIIYTKTDNKHLSWGDSKKYCIDGKWFYFHSLAVGPKNIIMAVIYRYDAYKNEIDEHYCSK